MKEPSLEISIKEIYTKYKIFPSLNEAGELTKTSIRKIRRRSKNEINLEKFKIEDLNIKLKKENNFDFLESIVNKKNEKIIIEAAHIYTDENISGVHEIGARIGASLNKIFKEIGYSTEIWLLIDDIPSHNPQGKTFSLDSYLDFLKDYGVEPEVIVFESSLEESSYELLEKLEKNEKIYSKNNEIYLKKGDVLLLKENEPSCSLLDAAFYVEKLKYGKHAVTVLPIEFRSQQRNTKLILKSLEEDINRITNIFFDSKLNKDIPEIINKKFEDHLKLINLAKYYFLEEKGLNSENIRGFIHYCKENLIKYIENDGKGKIYKSKKEINCSLSIDLEAFSYVC